MGNSFDKLVSLAEDEASFLELGWGHEPWIVFGREQHGEYWWIAIGDCSNRIFDPSQVKDSNSFSGEYSYFSKAPTLEKAARKLLIILAKRGV